MPRPCCQSFRNSGFVLLQTLWLLLLASLLTTVVLTTSLSNARDGAATVSAFRVEMAAESAVHVVLHDMLTAGPHSAWVRRVAASKLPIDGTEVTVSVTDANGLVDLNAANEATLRRFLAAALPTREAATLLNAIKAARPIGDYSTLIALEGMEDVFESLSPYVTLYSKRSLPSAESAPDWLAKVLRLEKGDPGVLSDTSAITGRVFKIEATARSNVATSRKLSAEVLITGRLDQPLWVYDWRWHPIVGNR